MICLSASIFAQEGGKNTNEGSSNLTFRAVAEKGFLSVLSHTIQFGQSGTNFDYVDNGGQDVLFPVMKLSLEMDFNERNTIILLYQPLRLETTSFLKEDLIANGVTFPAETGLKSLYNFPFYRVSYLRELAVKSDKFDLSIGGTIQIRNATITFQSTDGTLYTDNRDIGIVSAFKLRSRWNQSESLYTELEADGIYAPISYLNGSDNDVVGAILDANLRQGFRFNEKANIYLNLRYLGGGASGQSTENQWPGDGYTENWLNFLLVSAGFALHLN